MRTILSIVAVLILAGCGEDANSDNNATNIIERTEVTVPNDSVIVLDENQSIGYKPNTDVTIVNMGDNSYYIICNDGSCPINVDNSIDESSQSSSTTTTDSSSVTYVDSNTTDVSSNGGD